jgi:cytochrome o ubiquinol oxidase subunit II
MLDGSDKRSKPVLAAGPVPAAGPVLAAGVRRAVILAPLLLTACAPGVLDPAGPVGSAERTLLIDSLAIMLAIVVPTIVATFAFAWWYRASNLRAKYRPDFEYSGQLEMVVWFIPLLTITLLGGVAWLSSHELDPAVPLASDKPPLEVQVVSMDWKWLFIYPQQRIAAVNQLMIPAGVPVHFALTSASVMNTFFVPQLGSMIYTMNGMATQLNLQADAPGVFRGRSTMISGDGFPDMYFDVHAVPPDAFDAWTERARANGPTLDGTSYRDLSKQGTTRDPYTFRDVEPGLFGAIVTQRLPPGPGPVLKRPDPSILSPQTEY